MKRPALTLGLWLWTIVVSAQINHISLGLERNLPSKSVYGICEDAQGRIWIGTDNGVAYFQDGTFKRLNNPELPSLVLRVFPARDSGVYLVGNNPGGVWLVYKQGIISKSKPTGRTSYTGHLVSYSQQSETIYFCDWHHILGIGEKGLDTIFKVIGSTVSSLNVDLNGLPYTTNSTGLFGYVDSGFDTISRSAFSTSTFLDDGRFVGLSKKEILVFEENSIADTLNWHNSFDITPSHAVAHGNTVWFTGVHSGLFQLVDGNVVHISEKLQMTKIQFTYVFVDSYGNVWCGTNGNGIVVLPKYEYLKNFTEVSGLSDEKVRAVSHAPTGESYIITKTNFHLVNELNIRTVKEVQDLPKVNIEHIQQVTSVAGQRLFCFGHHARPRARLPESYSYGLGIPGSAVLYFQNQLVIGGVTWLEVWDVNTDTHRSKPNFTLKYSRGDHPYSTIKEILGVDSGYLVAGNGGIFKYLNDKNELSKMPVPNEPEGYFLAINKTSKGQLLATTRHHVYNWDSTEWKVKLPFDSLKSGILTDLAIDAYDHVWIGTENGLIHMDDGHITSITTLNGLLDNNIQRLDYKPYDSSLWVTTIYGISVIDIKTQELGSRYQNPLFIKSANVINGEKYTLKKALTLASQENNFVVSYGVSEHFGLGFPEYRYRLRETGGKWKYTHTSQAEFLSLSPGTYTFEIEARAPGKLWSNTKTATIHIELPFWKRWSFYTSVSLGLFLLTSVVYFIRLRSIRAQDKEKRAVLVKMNHLELQALNANMNPHFIFNSLNSIQHYLLPLKNIQAINYVSNLSKLIRLNMQAVGKKLVHLDGELQRTELYIKLEQERFDKALDYTIELHLSNSSKAIWIPSMIIQPAVENAIWHGIMPSSTPGIVEIIVKEQDDFLHVLVQDNGVGLSHSKKNKKPGHESMGTNLTFERLRLQHKENSFHIEEIFDENGVTQGTRVEIKIKTSLTY